MTQQKINIDLNKCSDVQCQRCKGSIFVQMNLLKIIPALLSPSGQEMIYPIPVFYCPNCQLPAGAPDIQPIIQ